MTRKMTQGTRIPAIRFLAAGIVLLVFCGGSRLSAQEKTPPPTQAPEAAKLVQVIPPEEKTRKNPIPSSPDSIESGLNLYSSQCTMCHGPAGNGKGELAEKMQLKVPDFTSASAMKKRTDGELHYILRKGHGEMPPETRLEEKDLWDMINYIRSLARTKNQPTQ